MNPESEAVGETKILRRELLQFGWVGPVNFIVGYGSFLFFLYLFAGSDYRLALVASHLVGSSVAFVLYRKFVFRAAGNLLWDYLRFQSTYVFAFGLNVIVLFLFVDLMRWRVELAQFVALVLVASATFLAHKYFSFFRRASQPVANG